MQLVLLGRFLFLSLWLTYRFYLSENAQALFSLLVFFHAVDPRQSQARCSKLRDRWVMLLVLFVLFLFLTPHRIHFFHLIHWVHWAEVVLPSNVRTLLHHSLLAVLGL